MKPTRLPPSLAWSFSLSPRLSRLLALVCAALLTLLCLTIWAPSLKLLEERLGALGWVLWPDQQAEQRLTLIAIDEKSLTQLGSWPWPRPTLTALSQQLAEAGASQQIYDIVLPEGRSGDALLAQSLQQQHGVIAQIPLLQSRQPLQSGVLGGAIKGLRCQAPIPTTQYFLGNHSTFASVAKGHITPIVDDDGMIRHVPPLICVDGRVYPSLALSALLNATHQRPESLSLHIQPGEGLLSPPWWLKIDGLPGLSIPLDEQGNMRLDYRQSPNAFTAISAVDIINGEQPDGLLDNTWALVGATAFGLGDVVPTPHRGMAAGLELQARMMSDLLDGSTPYTPKIAPWLQVLLSLGIAGALLLLAARPGKGSFIGLPLVGIIAPALVLMLHNLVLVTEHVWLGWVPSALFANVAAALLLLLEYGRTRFERLRVYNNLSSYLPEQVAHEIAYHQPSDAVRARRQELVVFCADLRNYSAYQETRSAEEAAALLHCFFVEAARIVEQYGGTLHEFKGDALIATWPLCGHSSDYDGDAQADSTADRHALHDKAENQQIVSQSYHAGIALITHMQQILPQHPLSGLEPMSVDVGIDSGSVLVGSIGPAHRRHHALMGLPLTSALRIQALATDLGQPLLMGEHAAHYLVESPDSSDLQISAVGSKAPCLLASQGRYMLEGLRQPCQLYAPAPGALPEPELPHSEQDALSQMDLRLIKGGRRP